MDTPNHPRTLPELALNDFVRPTTRFPEIARGQEIEVERKGFEVLGVGVGGLGHSACALEVLAADFDLVVDVFRVEHFAEVLDLDVAVVAIGCIVGPVLGVEAPALAVVELLERFGELEAAHEDDLAADFAELGNCWADVPFVGVRGVLFHDVGELFVVCVPAALALERYDDGLAGVLL